MNPLRILSLVSILLLTKPLVSYASDISFYGGRQSIDTEDLNTVAVSLGIDVPSFFGPISPNQVRTDVSYLFDSFEVPISGASSIPDFNNAVAEVDFGTLTIHAGPGWRYEILDRVAIFAAAQAGVAISQASTELVSVAPPSVDVANKFTDTNFSYQFPVGIEYGFSKRVAITARYRGLGITGGGASSFTRIFEGGIVIRF